MEFFNWARTIQHIPSQRCREIFSYQRRQLNICKRKWRWLCSCKWMSCTRENTLVRKLDQKKSLVGNHNWQFYGIHWGYISVSPLLPYFPILGYFFLRFWALTKERFDRSVLRIREPGWLILFFQKIVNGWSQSVITYRWDLLFFLFSIKIL